MARPLELTATIGAVYPGRCELPVIRPQLSANVCVLNPEQRPCGTGCVLSPRGTMRDQYVTIQPAQAITEPHRTNLGYCEKACKYAALLMIAKPGEGLKIRRYLVPWGFNSPSRHHFFFVVNDLRVPEAPHFGPIPMAKTADCSKTVVILRRS
jgi:hypothetical protein